MLTLHRASDGAPIYISAALVASISPDLNPENTEICAAGFPFIVRESPTEVARLVAEAQRTATGIDLEAVETARRILNAIEDACLDANRKNEAGFESYAYEVLGRIDRLLNLGDEAPWDESAAALRALAARLGGAS